MKKLHLFSFIYITLLTLVVSAPVVGQASRPYIQVVIYDVHPGNEKKFEAAMEQDARAAASAKEFINDRLLKNLDDLALQYASYTKFTNRSKLEQFHRNRLSKIQGFCSRPPESHLVQLTDAYFGKTGYSKSAKGLEFGKGKVGQVAHIGLFIPFPEYRPSYDATLREVKALVQQRNPAGYIGEDLAVEVDLIAPKLQAPYSPRATIPSPMSVNYGEYETFENAEDAYVTRNSKPDAKVSILQRSFFSVLQVPTRFYIFKVIGNRSRGDAV